MSSSLTRPRLEYYAWRHLPLHSFEGLSVLFTLFETLTHIPHTVTEPSVARQKLAFFQKDIAAVNHAPQHPQVQALKHLLQKYSLDLSPFKDLYIAIETSIDHLQSIDDADLNRYCQRKRGSLLLLCAEWLKQSPLTETEKNNIKQTGIFIERVILLQERNRKPEQSYLFPIKDFLLEDYIQNTIKEKPLSDPFFNLTTTLYEILLKQLQSSLSMNPYASITLNPIHTLLLTIFYRLKGVK